VDEPERLGHEVLGDPLLDALDREAAPAGVLSQHREVVQRELARLFGHHEMHRLEVRLGAPGLGLQVGRHLHQRRRRGAGRAAHARPEDDGVALEALLRDVAGQLEDLPVRIEDGVSQANLVREAWRDSDGSLDIVDNGDHLPALEDCRRGLAQQQRDRVPSRTPEQDGLGACLDVAHSGDVGRGALAGLPLHEACGDPLQDHVIGLGVPRPLALGELAVGGELLRGRRRGALLDPPIHHRPFNDGGERRTVARDESVDVLGRIPCRQLGAPAGQQLLEGDCSGRHVVLGRGVATPGGGGSLARPHTAPANCRSPSVVDLSWSASWLR
jgi:hypothetical protein